MPVYTAMGLKKIFIAPASEDGVTMPANGDSWKDLGDVYQDTCQLVDSDPETTQHKSETSNRKIVQVGETETTVNLSLMDPDLELLARYFGGEVSGEKGSRKWTRPRKLPYKEWAIWLQPEEGVFIGGPCVRIIPKFEITYSKTGICLVPMTIQYQGELQIDESMTDPTQGA